MDTEYRPLSEARVEESRRLHGANVMTPPKRRSALAMLLEKFHDPLIVILLIAGMLSVGISCYEYYGLGASAQVFFEPVGIFAAILLATVLAFIFEFKAEKEFSLLSEAGDLEPVEVIREGGHREIARRDVVVGDIVVLHTGDEIPADGRLLEATDLNVDESTLTGEPLCHKTANPAHFDAEATYPSDHVYRGTRVMEGHAIMVVTAVGDATEAGNVFRDVSIDSSVKTPLREQLDRLGGLITKCSYLIAAGIIVGRLVRYFNWHWAAWTMAIPVVAFFWVVIKGFPHWGKRRCLTASLIFTALFAGWTAGVFALATPGGNVEALMAYVLQTVMVAVTLIVVAVPEGLPMAITLSLAYSMRRMFKTNNLVRTLHACETMGATTVICTDKTGTLTRNMMSVADHRFFGNIDADAFADAVALNTTASLDTGGEHPKGIGNPTECALLKAFAPDYDARRSRQNIVEETPFSTERKYMSVKTVDSAGHSHTYLKGAPEVVMDMSSLPEGVTKDAIEETLADWQRRGMRTLAFAEGDKPVLTAIVAIADPVRDDVPAAIAECRNAGIDIKIVTGDNPATAREIARQIGIADADKGYVTGPEFAAMDDAQVAALLPDLKVIARARPADKKRLVEALAAKGEVVAVTGDGTNDAPALKAAHVGLSMGDGTSVAKNASDITILDNSFASIGRAVMWGRSLYRNIQRFLLFQLTVNVAACLLVLAGSFMGTRSPLTVTQMLWVNLIMDTFGAMALSSLPPSRRVMLDKPRNRRASIITGPMASNIFGVGVLFFVISLVFLWIFQHSDFRAMTDLLRLGELLDMSHSHELSTYEATLLFSIFVWTHFWYMFCARGFKSGASALQLRHCSGFLLIALIIVVGQVLIVECVPAFFNVEPMSIEDWIIIVGGSSLVLWVRELHRLIASR